MKRLHFSIRTLLLIVISILNILIAAPLGYLAYKSFLNYENAKEIEHITKTLHFLYNTKRYLSLERAAAFSLLYVPASSFEVLNEEILVNRIKSEKAYEIALGFIQETDERGILTAVEGIEQSFIKLRMLRLKMNTAVLAREKYRGSVLPNQYFQQITSLNRNIDDLIDVYSQNTLLFNPEVIRQMRLTHLIWEITEYAGQEYAILGRLIAQNKFPDSETREKLISLRGRIKYGLELAQDSVISSRWRKSITPSLEEVQSHYLTIFDQIKDIFYQPATAPVATLYPVTVEMWLQLASEAVSSLNEMTDAVLNVNQYYVGDIKRSAAKSIYTSLFLFMCALALSFYTWQLITARVINPVNEMVEALYKETKSSEQHIQESDKLDEITKLQQVLQVFRDKSHQLEKERDKAQAANIAKSEFLANMSHEIRTPMNVVVGLSNILSKSKPLTEKQTEFIKTLQVSAESLLSLINDLLDFSKIEAQSFELENTRFNLAQLVNELVFIKKFKAKQKNLAFKTDIKGLEGKEYMGDPTRIRQILVNLCGNAIKFTEKGAVTLKIRARSDKQTGYEIIDIFVTDTGIGIPEDKVGLIFEKFTQADASIVRKYGGTGLGLAITKNLVEMMNGQISVESVPKKGTTFHITFPLKLKAQQSLFLSDEISEKRESKYSGQQIGRILLVEDYYPNTVVASTFLEEFGYGYDVAENGQEAVQKFMENKYDAILMDIQMPGMDGYQATQIIREYERESGSVPVKIVGLTAHASLRDKEKCLAVGMDDYLSKPFGQKNLKDVLQN